MPGLKRYFAAVAAAVTTTLLPVVPTHAQDAAHGSIAFGRYAEDQAVSYGFAWNFAGADEAREAAMSGCVAGGGTDCGELVWFENGCGALALDRHGSAQGRSGMTREHAEAAALQTCVAAGGAGCAVIGAQCAGPGGQAGTWSSSQSVLAPPEEPGSMTARGPGDETLTREQRVRAQQGLAMLGFDAVPADGAFGPRTRSAIWQWQQAKGNEATGYLTRDEAETLAAGAPIREKAASQEAARGTRSGNQVLYFAAAGPKCTGMPEGSDCWKEISNKPGCFFFDLYYRSDSTITWSGSCSGVCGASGPPSCGPCDVGVRVWNETKGISHWSPQQRFSPTPVLKCCRRVAAIVAAGRLR